jgi:hypothetical protein
MSKKAQRRRRLHSDRTAAAGGDPEEGTATACQPQLAGSFSGAVWDSPLFRRFDMPTLIDVNRVKAELDMGVLTVIAPKQAARHRRPECRVQDP